MDPVTAGMLGAVGGSALGGILGQGDRERAMRILRQVQEEAGPSAFGQMEQDPLLLQRQIAAMEQLRGLYDQGGMDTASKARLAQAQNATGAAERGSREAITQNMQMRGMGGSGVDLAAQLSNQQGAAQRNAMAGAQAAGDASTRAIQALLQSSQIGGNVRGQNMQKAGGLDAMSQFNAAQRLRKAGMMAGAYNDQADRTANMLGGAGTAVGAFLGG